jgi:dephospho-CoA kinase
MILGITGNSGSKKSSVAKQLARAHGFDRIHAGMPLKRAMRKGLGLTKAQTDGDLRERPTMQLGGVEPRQLMEATSDAWHKAAPHATSVVMQRRVAKRMAKGHSVVVEGVRSPVEAAMLKHMGGTILRCDNGSSPDPSKPMDKLAAAIKVDYTIDTSGKKSERKAAVDKMLQDIRM